MPAGPAQQQNQQQQQQNGMCGGVWRGSQGRGGGAEAARRGEQRRRRRGKAQPVGRPRRSAAMMECGQLLNVADAQGAAEGGARPLTCARAAACVSRSTASSGPAALWSISSIGAN